MLVTSTWVNAMSLATKMLRPALSVSLAPLTAIAELDVPIDAVPPAVRLTVPAVILLPPPDVVTTASDVAVKLPPAPTLTVPTCTVPLPVAFSARFRLDALLA